MINFIHLNIRQFNKNFEDKEFFQFGMKRKKSYNVCLAQFVIRMDIQILTTLVRKCQPF